MSYTIELEYEQVESIITRELKTAIELCMMNLTDPDPNENDLEEDHELLPHLLKVLEYFSSRLDFENYVKEVEIRFSSPNALEKFLH